MSIVEGQKEFAQLADLYVRMEQAYDQVAKALDFSCQDCPDNCCDSFFQHHTYSEWAYLWEGLMGLDEEKRRAIKTRAKEYVGRLLQPSAAAQSPVLMCPLNEAGLCSLYRHRLMICRMHGVPSRFTLPNGATKEFGGCFRCQEQTAGRANLPTVDRTPFYRELAELERRLLTEAGRPIPRVKMTIAEMIVQGPPRL
jgi:Fe-S-cluster containining protein